ncbi:MAG: LCP family protein [Oscillospiraceae bacterium]|jgi:LCP family protein required for cell wall assembly|nr:LCP family protein [Oscillospiraceae bacterium]
MTDYSKGNVTRGGLRSSGAKRAPVKSAAQRNTASAQRPLRADRPEMEEIRSSSGRLASSGRDVHLGSRRGQQEAARKSVKKRLSRRAVLNIIGSAVLTLSTLTVAFTLMLGWRVLSGGNYDNESWLGEQGTPKSPSKGKGATYILVCGLDWTGGSNFQSGNTDVMMMVCWDHEKNTVNILQIPRDTFVGVRYGYGKINGAYSHPKDENTKDGVQSLVSRINKTIGMRVDYYVLFSIEALRTVVDTMGGVDVELPKKYKMESMHNKPRYNLGPGAVHLDGEMAEDLMRNRHNLPGGDEERVEVQRIFYAGFIRGVLSMDKSKLLSLLTKCYGDVKTDLSLAEANDYTNAGHQLKIENMNIYALPGTSATRTVQGIGVSQSYFSMYAREYIQLLNERFNPYGKPITQDQLEIHELVTNRSDGYAIDPGGPLAGQ